ncbi:hypothetical protein MKW94_029606 [Papaver nudicaule]|uniref:DUF761 domain-containing protein n=1 Tax=Papaver nudicaule TaxID=74823 RepID=A0AA41VVV2_PAPNU|nr:hypothetical protein [Papaver nudicaule]
MKTKASNFFKQILNVLSTVVKAKSMAIKTKTSAMKTRLLIFSLLKTNRKVLVGTITHKIHALIGHLDSKKHDDNNAVDEDKSKAIVLYNPSCTTAELDYYYYNNNDDDNKYPDLTHGLFDLEDDDFVDQAGSVIDLVKNAKEEDGENFSLEDEIDTVADLFIRRFHRQMKMQKQESFKRRYQELLANEPFN